MDHSLFVHVINGLEHLPDQIRCVLLCVRSFLNDPVKQFTTGYPGNELSQIECSFTTMFDEIYWKMTLLVVREEEGSVGESQRHDVYLSFLLVLVFISSVGCLARFSLSLSSLVLFNLSNVLEHRLLDKALSTRMKSKPVIIIRPSSFLQYTARSMVFQYLLFLSVQFHSQAFDI